jgi:MscS family membrane protein
VFFEVQDWSEELKARQNFILEAIRLAKELNVRFAFPTTTVHLEEMPGQEPLTPTYNEDEQEFLNKANKFVSKRKDKYNKDF